MKVKNFGYRKSVNLTGVFKDWVFPEHPSTRAKKLIEELNRQAMDLEMDGPAIEYRVYKTPTRKSPFRSYWLDICYFLSDGTKINIEVDEEHHDTAEQKAKDRDQDQYLKSNGWIIKRIHYTRIDNEPIGGIAWEILFSISLMEFELGQKKEQKQSLVEF